MFTENPSRYNGKVLTIKNIRLNLNSNNRTSGIVALPSSQPNGAINAKSGAGTTAMVPASCITPKGFKQLDVVFVEKPDFQSCFFINDALYLQLKKEVKGKTLVDVQLTLRGDNRAGYNIESYRLQ
jgi:hypothetical protein